MDHINPAKLMRERLLQARREAVQNGRTEDVVRLQGEIVALDLVIVEEESILKAANRTGPRVREL